MCPVAKLGRMATGSVAKRLTIFDIPVGCELAGFPQASDRVDCMISNTSGDSGVVAL